MQRVWNAVEVWAEATAASDLHPIHAAVAVLDQPDGVQSEFRGLAYADFYPHNSRLLHRGASLVLGSVVNVGANIAHEIGHDRNEPRGPRFGPARSGSGHRVIG